VPGSQNGLAGQQDLVIRPTRVPGPTDGSRVEVEFTNYFGSGKNHTVYIDAVYLNPSAGSSAVSLAREKAAAAATCTANRLTAVFTSPGSQFEVPAALPVNLEARVVDDCGNPLTAGATIVTFSSGEPGVALSSWPDGVWRATWQPLAPQTGLVTLRLSAVGIESGLKAQAIVSGTITASGEAPIVLSNAVVNSASQQRGNDTIAPGQIITIYGRNLARAATLAPNGVPQSTVGGVRVRLGGVVLPLFYVGPGQINAVTPFALPLQKSQQLIVERDGVPSVPLSLTIVSAQPGVFTMDQSGTGQAAIVGPTGKVADLQNPVSRGDVISIYCTGLGAVDRAVDISRPAPSQEPLPRVAGRLSVLIGNSSAEVLYAGLAPGFYGLYQLNVRVPAGAPLGAYVPVQVALENLFSNQITLAIR
jgi:uncharacterized protein (TIGR03437 family)